MVVTTHQGLNASRSQAFTSSFLSKPIEIKVLYWRKWTVKASPSSQRSVLVPGKFWSGSKQKIFHSDLQLGFLALVSFVTMVLRSDSLPVMTTRGSFKFQRRCLVFINVSNFSIEQNYSNDQKADWLRSGVIATFLFRQQLKEAFSVFTLTKNAM